MQSIKEKAAVQAFYYGKIAEGMRIRDAGKLIQMSVTVEPDWTSVQYCDNFGVNWEYPHYRIKPKTVMHQGGEYPEPCRDSSALLEAKVFYEPAFNIDDSGMYPSFTSVHNSNKSACDIFAKCGFYHLTEEAALQHAKVLYGNKGEES